MELSSERKQPEVDLNRWPLRCPAAAQLAGSQPESKDKEWTEFKAERVDLSVRGVHCSLSKTLVVLAASPHGTMIEDRSDLCTWMQRGAICLWNLMHLSCVRVSLHKLTRDTAAFFFFSKMTKWCLGGESEQVRQCFCTAAPSPPASLPICPLARLSAFNKSCFAHRLLCILYILPFACLLLLVQFFFTIFFHLEDTDVSMPVKYCTGGCPERIYIYV